MMMIYPLTIYFFFPPPKEKGKKKLSGESKQKTKTRFWLGESRVSTEERGVAHLIWLLRFCFALFRFFTFCFVCEPPPSPPHHTHHITLPFLRSLIDVRVSNRTAGQPFTFTLARRAAAAPPPLCLPACLPFKFSGGAG